MMMEMIEKCVVFWVNIMTVFIFEFAQKLAKKTVFFMNLLTLTFVLQDLTLDCLPCVALE